MEPVGRYVLPRPVRARLDAWLCAADTLGREDVGNAWLTGPRKPKDDLDYLIAECDRALPIAQAIGEPTVLLETRCVRALLVASKALLALHKEIRSRDSARPAAAGHDRVQAAGTAVDTALEEVARLIEAALSRPEVDPDYGPRTVKDTYREWVGALRKKVARAAGTAGDDLE